MNPTAALELLEQSANLVQCDALARRKLFEAVDLLKGELNRLAGYDANRDAVVEKPHAA